MEGSLWCQNYNFKLLNTLSESTTSMLNGQYVSYRCFLLQQSVFPYLSSFSSLCYINFICLYSLLHLPYLLYDHSMSSHGNHKLLCIYVSMHFKSCHANANEEFVELVNERSTQEVMSTQRTIIHPKMVVLITGTVCLRG